MIDLDREMAELARTVNTPSVPPASERARAQAEQLVQTVCEQALLELQTRRDEIDNLMTRIHESKSKLVEYISEFSRFSCDVIKVSSGMEEAIKIIAQPFQGTPPATITHRNGNGNGKHA